MEGFTLLRMLREQLEETSSSTFMNERTSYDYLWSAIKDFNFRTHYLTSYQSISVVAGTTDYNLNPDFVQIALLDSYNRPVIKHTYSGSDTFLTQRDYQNIYLENSSATAAVATSYSIVDATQLTNKTGTATATNAASNGESTLEDTLADFSTVYPGDFVHNTTDSTHGIVTALTDNTHIVVALFDANGASGSGWNAGDAYIIVPQPRYKLVISPIPSATATLTVPYVQRPNPVYSNYRAYRFPFDYTLPIVQFAAFLYKYKDSEPNYGDALFKYYDGFARKIAAEMRRGTEEKKGIRVNLSKLNARSKSIGNWSR